MTLTDMYRHYIDAKDDVVKSAIKSMYIYKGGKRLKLDTPLDLVVYKKLCGWNTVKRYITEYNENNKIYNNRSNVRENCETLIRIFIKSISPEIFQISNLDVHDNGTSIAVLFKGMSTVTGEWFDSRYLIDTPNCCGYLGNLLIFYDELVYLAFNAIGYKRYLDIKRTIAEVWGTL